MRSSREAARDGDGGNGDGDDERVRPVIRGSFQGVICVAAIKQILIVSPYVAGTFKSYRVLPHRKLRSSAPIPPATCIKFNHKLHMTFIRIIVVKVRG